MAGVACSGHGRCFFSEAVAAAAAAEAAAAALGVRVQIAFNETKAAKAEAAAQHLVYVQTTQEAHAGGGNETDRKAKEAHEEKQRLDKVARDKNDELDALKAQHKAQTGAEEPAAEDTEPAAEDTEPAAEDTEPAAEEDPQVDRHSLKIYSCSALSLASVVAYAYCDANPPCRSKPAVHAIYLIADFTEERDIPQSCCASAVQPYGRERTRGPMHMRQRIRWS